MDGPVINTPCLFLHPGASIRRECLNTGALGYIKRFCNISGAKVVTNSMHNYENIPDSLVRRTLKYDLIDWGLPAKIFHDDWRTEFGKDASHNRLTAIHQWQAHNGPADWVCFDDVHFTEDKRLILIDFDRGIDHSAYRKALKVYGYRQVPLWLGD